MGVNGDLMEQWATSMPMQVIEQRADDLFQLEALFLGQAGLLELETIPEQFHHDALNEGYFAKLRNEYLYLAHKYSLLPLDGRQWKAEKNAITKHWAQYGIKTEAAGDSQALIQLQREYCDKRQCLRCRFGYEFLRGRTKIEGYMNLAIEPDLFTELY